MRTGVFVCAILLCFFSRSYGEIVFLEIPSFPAEVSDGIHKDSKGQFSKLELSRDGKHSVIPYDVYRGDIVLQLLNMDYVQSKHWIDGRHSCDNRQNRCYVWSSNGDKMAYSGCREGRNGEKLYVNHKLIKEFEPDLEITQIWFESCFKTEIPTVILENEKQQFQFINGQIYPLSENQIFHTKSFPDFGRTKIETLDSGKQKLTVGEDTVICDNVRWYVTSQDNLKIAFLTETSEKFKIYEIFDGKIHEYPVDSTSDGISYYANNILHFLVSSRDKYRLFLMEGGKQNCINFSQGDVQAAAFRSLDSGVIVAQNADSQLQAFVYNGKDTRMLPMNNSWITFRLEPNSIFWYIWTDGKDEILVSEGKEIIKAQSLDCVRYNPESDRFSYVCSCETKGKVYLHCNGKVLGPFKTVNPIIELYDDWFTVVQDEKTEKYHFVFNGQQTGDAFDNVFMLENHYGSNCYHTFGVKNKKWYKIEITLPCTNEHP